MKPPSVLFCLEVIDNVRGPRHSEFHRVQLPTPSVSCSLIATLFALRLIPLLCMFPGLI